jgi:hypothetical protein
MNLASITIWPKDNNTSPKDFLIYGVVWFLVILGAIWMSVGYYATSILTQGGTHVASLDCSTDGQNIPNGCSDQSTGNYIKSTVDGDAAFAGVVVGIVTISSYVGHRGSKREAEERKEEERRKKAEE